MAKSKTNIGGFVYSTNPDFKPELPDDQETDNIPENQLNIRVYLDRLGGNKMVSRVSGFPPRYPAIDEIGRNLKQKCGVGGSVKNGEILIQGDHRDKIIAILLKDGIKAKKAGG